MMNAFKFSKETPQKALTCFQLTQIGLDGFLLDLGSIIAGLVGQGRFVCRACHLPVSLSGVSGFWLIAFIIGGVLIPGRPFAASFDCEIASTSIEVLICTNPDISNADSEMALIYSRVRQSTPDIVHAQRDWLKQRSACKNATCLRTMYSERIKDLTTLLSPSNQVAPQQIELRKIPKQENLGIAYDKDTGLKQDYAGAMEVERVRKAAEQGDVDAQFNLGYLYDQGNGIKQDYVEAMKWFRKAAEQGDSSAQFNLGVGYRDGIGVIQDYVEAVKWFRMAAVQSNQIAQYNLGLMYLDGKGVVQDYAETVKWFRKAAEKNYAKAQYGLGLAYRDGKGVKQDYTQAIEWFRKAAEQGNAEAQGQLGAAYYLGEGVKQDDAEAVKWIRKAAEQGNAGAEYILGLAYRDGKGVKQDYTQAIEWFHKAAKQGHAEAQLVLRANRLDSRINAIQPQRTPKQLAVLHEKSSVSCLTFSPDSKTLASGGMGPDGTLVIRDVVSGQPTGKPFEFSGVVRSIAFSPDGKILAMAGEQHLGKDKWGASQIYLWDVITHQTLGAPFAAQEYVESIAFSPDGKILASGGKDGVRGLSTVILWNVATRQPLGQRLDTQQVGIYSVAFSPDGKTLASGGDYEPILWDVATHQLLKKLTGHTGIVSKVAFSPNGKILASAAGTFDQSVRLWDLTTYTPLGQPFIAPQEINDISFSPDGNVLASAINAAFSPDGNVLASAIEGSNVILWDVNTHKPLGYPLEGHKDSVESVSFSPDGKILASGSFDETVILWDAATQ